MNYVLADNVINPITTDEFVAVEIIDPKKTALIVKVLNEKYPLPQHKHLRRVKSITDNELKKIHILICPLTDEENFTDDQHVRLLADSGIDVTSLSPQCYVTQAASAQPITRKQYEECKLSWPTCFHEDKSLEAKIGTIEYSAEDRLYIDMACQVAKRSTATNYQCGAVIVDPMRDKIVGIGYSRTDVHVLQHAAMVAIDSVAHSNGAGVWGDTPLPATEQPSYPDGSDQYVASKINEK